MIDRIETTLEKMQSDIKRFYDKKVWHFLTLNGVQLDENSTEIQWIFSKYGQKDAITLFYLTATRGDIIPSVTDILPSAIISQREIVDMFGIEIEGSPKGLYLDEDSLTSPLSRCRI